MPSQITLPFNACVCGNQGCQISYGLCHCGCGGQTKIATQNISKRGRYVGKPNRFIRGHRTAGWPRKVLPKSLCICRDETCTTPYGYCHCGCGQKTSIATITDRLIWKENGRPLRYARGHNSIVKFDPQLPDGLCICRQSDCAIPYGLCHCGCGGVTTVSRNNNKLASDIRGVPKKFINFHSTTAAKIGEKNRQYLAKLKSQRKGYIGVTMTKSFRKPWRSTIGTAGGVGFKDLGVFATEEEAGRAYDAESIERYGNLAQLNFPDQYPDFMEAQRIRIGKEKEIARRIINTEATIISIAKEEGCSFSKINVMYRKYTTKDERLQAKHRKTGKSNTGKIRPKISASNKGRKVWNKGRKLSMEERIARSAYSQGVTVEQWKGFTRSLQAMVTSSLEYKTWRKAVYQRDNWTCQHCKKSGGCLHAHHIKPKSTYPELMFDVYNGLTLCEKCHHKVHTKIEETRSGMVVSRRRKKQTNTEGEDQAWQTITTTN